MTVLDGRHVSFTAGGTALNIGGVDDPTIDAHSAGRLCFPQDGRFNLLLAQIPCPFAAAMTGRAPTCALRAHPRRTTAFRAASPHLPGSHTFPSIFGRALYEWPRRDDYQYGPRRFRHSVSPVCAERGAAHPSCPCAPDSVIFRLFPFSWGIYLLSQRKGRRPVNDEPYLSGILCKT